MEQGIWLFFSGLFVLAAACYLLFITSDPLEEVGGKLGKLLHLPEDVIASTFQALATSGPEIIMAILAATPFILGEAWSTLQIGERASSGTLNMAFSAMDNLLGIGAVGIIFMISRGSIKKDDYIILRPSSKIGLAFYVVSSGSLSWFIADGILTNTESWVLMIIGILFILSQFIIPIFLKNNNEDEENIDYEPPSELKKWFKELFTHGFIYAFLVFALIVFVRESLGATFNMAMVGVFSVGGILIMFTSYVSSFPEFMMTYRYAIANKKDALLGMLFGSNVIDLAFAGFRPIWLGEPMAVYTTGIYSSLLNYYIYALPILALLILVGLATKKVKYKIAYPLVVFYIIYIVSGFILL